VPVIDRQLAGHNRRAAIVPILDNLKDVATLLGGKRGEAPIVLCGRPPMASTFLTL
jgi:hypothetical protein